MTAAALVSGTREVDDAFAANELFQRNGWTDGLPIVPPTEAGVRIFLDAGRCAPGEPGHQRVAGCRRHDAHAVGGRPVCQVPAPGA